MPLKDVRSARKTLFWGVLVAAIGVPLAYAAASPLLAWRGPIYIIACFAGIIGLGLLLVQPLLIGGMLPGVVLPLARRAHQWIGGLLVTAVLVHIGGLWVTSPPDVIDILLFSSPTPFSIWGVIAMWVLFATALLAVLRRRLPLRPHLWRIVHKLLAVMIVTGTVVHALLIEGLMETITKASLCALVLAVSIIVIFGLRNRLPFQIWLK